MAGQQSVILVVNHGEGAALNLKELIEFMDAPPVRIAAPEHWRDELGGQRLTALFIGPDMTASEIDVLLSGVRELDPNVPIVMMNETGRA